MKLLLVQSRKASERSEIEIWLQRVEGKLSWGDYLRRSSFDAWFAFKSNFVQYIWTTSYVLSTW